MISKIGRGACAAAIALAVSGCGGSGVDPGNGSLTNDSGDTSGEMFEQDNRNVGPMGSGDVGGGADMIDTDVPSDNVGAGDTGPIRTDDATRTVGGGKGGGGTTGG